MKNIFLIIALAFFTGAQAQNAGKAEVEKTVAQFVKAMEDSNLKILAALTTPKLTYGHSNGKIENKAQFLETFKTGASDFLNIVITDQTVEISGNTAIVRHLLNADTNDKDQPPGHVALEVLMVWQKQAGKWILLARQGVKPPVK